MFAVLFVPLGAPPKDKSHVAPVRDVAIVQSADDCTQERLGDGVSPEACRESVKHFTRVVVRFRYDERPCGGDRCTTATDICYTVDDGVPALLWTPSRTTASGVHSLVLDMDGKARRCVSIQAVRLPENALSQTVTECARVTQPAVITPPPH